jgi:plastocyanin
MKNQPNDPNPSSRPSQPNDPNRPNQPAKAGSATEIMIESGAFSPQTFDAKVGKPVTWRNDDTAAHSVEFDPGAGVPPPTSPDIPAGGTYSYTFTVPGDYKYHCGKHKSMTGTVSVT